MPYIKKESRERVALFLKPMLEGIEKSLLTEGEMNYIITQMLISWAKPKLSYSKINASLGVLECVKLEFYRRLAAPYESAKASENGDIYRDSILEVLDYVLKAHTVKQPVTTK